MNILLINGPNLNMLGIREKAVYGSFTLEEVEDSFKKRCSEYGFSCDTFQSNIEGEIINKIHESYEKVDYIVINPGAFTHYSIAIRDAISAVSIKTIEVHISNVHKREAFRSKSVLCDIVEGQIVGLGKYGYILALEYIKEEVGA